MAMVVEEVTPEMIWDRLNNSNGQYKDSFSYDGICAIFEYFETMEYDREYEFYDIVRWDSMFYEAESAEAWLKEIEPDVYEELKNTYSEFDLSSECFNYIEKNYTWARVLDYERVIVYYER